MAEMQRKRKTHSDQLTIFDTDSVQRLLVAFLIYQTVSADGHHDLMNTRKWNHHHLPN